MENNIKYDYRHINRRILKPSVGDISCMNFPKLIIHLYKNDVSSPQILNSILHFRKMTFHLRKNVYFISPNFKYFKNK